MTAGTPNFVLSLGGGAAGALMDMLHANWLAAFPRALKLADYETFTRELRADVAFGGAFYAIVALAVIMFVKTLAHVPEAVTGLIGAGFMGRGLANQIINSVPGMRLVAIANRTLERGEKLAGRFGAEVMHLADLPERLHEFDAVISCTASTLPIIGLGAVERALKKRKHRPMFMVDLAVPRDIEPEVKRLGDVYLYTVDDLAGVVQTAQASRQAAVFEAEAIVDAGVQSFLHWVDQRNNVPLIQQLNSQADAWRAAELARARKALAKGEDVDAVLEALSKGLTQKMLHGAFAELHGADASSRERASHAIEHFFLRKER